MQLKEFVKWFFKTEYPLIILLSFWQLAILLDPEVPCVPCQSLYDAQWAQVTDGGIVQQQEFFIEFFISQNEKNK